MNLIIGMGQIGSALYEIFPDSQTLDRKQESIKLPIDVMHVTIPYNSEFIKIVKNYMKKYEPKHVVVYSTVAVGTTRKLGNNVVHSPIEGKHPQLVKGMKRFTRWIGGPKPTALAVEKLWEDIVDCKIVDSSDFTEFLKLYSTSKYGINIVWADYANEWAKSIGMDYQLIKDFDKDYNKLYHNFPQYRRYILDPPNGKIGGHCIVPNAEILDKQKSHLMLRMIKGMQ